MHEVNSRRREEVYKGSVLRAYVSRSTPNSRLVTTSSLFIRNISMVEIDGVHAAHASATALPNRAPPGVSPGTFAVPVAEDDSGPDADNEAVDVAWMVNYSAEAAFKRHLA